MSAFAKLIRRLQASGVKTTNLELWHKHMCNAVYEAAQVKELNFRKWSEKYQSAQFFEGHIIGALDMLYDLELVSTDECCEVSRELEKTLKGM